jgi:hypothetical protein
MLDKRLVFALVVGLGGGMVAAAPVQAAIRIERQLELAPGGQLIVRSSVGAVIVRGDSTSGAAVVVTSERDDFEKYYELRFSASPGRAEVIVKRRGPSWSIPFAWLGWRGRAQVAVSAPRATSVSVHTGGGRIEASGLEGEIELGSSGGPVVAHDLAGALDARSGGGKIEVRDLRGNLKLRSSGGGINAASVEGGAEVESGGGRIHLERIGGSLHASSSGGGVTVHDAGGWVEASSAGGPVVVAFAAGNARGGDLRSGGGGIQIFLDPAAGLELDTAGGSVACDLPLTVRGKVTGGQALRGELRGGGERLRIRSSGGGIRIAAL